MSEKIKKQCSLQEKITILGLLYLDRNQIAKIEEFYRAEIGSNSSTDYSKFDFVLWHNNKPFLYSRAFVDVTDTDEISAFVEANA